jgi:hypothetical protein
VCAGFSGVLGRIHGKLKTNKDNERKLIMKNRILMAILPVLACFAFLPRTQAQLSPPPDGCYLNFTTAEGCNALNSLTIGAGNTALGWFALSTDTDGSFNTAVGGGALVLNNGGSNTAVGAAALLLNTAGIENTAIGTDAMVFNDSGSGDTAVGFFALENDNGVGSNTGVGVDALLGNTTGFNNAAFGIRAMETNIDGVDNTAIGNLALDLSDHGSEHVCVGRHAGDAITGTSSNIIVLGHGSGVDGTLGQVDNSCYIDNIIGADIPMAEAFFVFVDSSGKLGTNLVAADGSRVAIPASSLQDFMRQGSPQAVPQPQRQANPDAQAMLNRKVEELEATVADLRTQLKDQAAQIQKVSAQVEMNKPAPKVVANKP